MPKITIEVEVPEGGECRIYGKGGCKFIHHGICSLFDAELYMDSYCFLKCPSCLKACGMSPCDNYTEDKAIADDCGDSKGQCICGYKKEEHKGV